ncbi:Putative NADPH-quinone reductase (modulator of drug activity B) [Faunimonas pinastri]|uniref:Putative NADPH-quinone reductase (Modulator of drug activity B) n=1 Tax=Faunimonas pinastri TaxID=1855383 RepID=A0A1H9M2B6_9HYPH|nr:NAD(P)H-dependent oxidoreductase [Faunimonas pinastri]SER17812.1 Putative NADPH-quinone reductase (modulator of drug activity B) [Faunimonas pinastri]
MRVLVLFAHPLSDSFSAALHRTVVEALTRAGHEVDDCDLYAEKFDPVLSAEERAHYHDEPENRAPVEGYVQRLLAAEALVFVHPVWNYGFPAILKGFIDRVFLPGVSFRMENGKAVPNLQNIRKLAAVTTYGGDRWRTLLMGDPPRRIMMRSMRVRIKPFSPVRYLALHDMNRADEARRERFLQRVKREMERF